MNSRERFSFGNNVSWCRCNKSIIGPFIWLTPSINLAESPVCYVLEVRSLIRWPMTAPSIHPLPHEPSVAGTHTCAEASVRRRDERCWAVGIVQELLDTLRVPTHESSFAMRSRLVISIFVTDRPSIKPAYLSGFLKPSRIPSRGHSG